MAEARNPIGYEKQKLYSTSSLTHVRVATYADMMKAVGNPGFFVVDNDEGHDGESDNQDVLYFWSGIEAKPVSDADIAAMAVKARNEAEALRNETQQIKEGVEATLPVTVATYADAVPLFTGDAFRHIDVLSDSVYNLEEDPDSPKFGQGLPSFYHYKPEFPAGQKVWFFGIDPDYLTSI